MSIPSFGYKHFHSAHRRLLQASIAQFFETNFPKWFGLEIRDRIAQELLNLIEDQCPAMTALRPGQCVWNAVPIDTRADSTKLRLIPVVLTLVDAADITRQDNKEVWEFGKWSANMIKTLRFGAGPTASLDMVLDDLAHSRESGGVFCGIYDLAGTMIGVVDFIAQQGFIDLLMISAPYRGMGVGKEVVKAIEATLRDEHGVTTMSSTVQCNNMAVKFWCRMGYRIISEPELQSDGTTIFRIIKELGAG